MWRLYQIVMTLSLVDCRMHFQLKNGTNLQSIAVAEKQVFSVNPKNYPPGHFEDLGLEPLFLKHGSGNPPL